MHPESKSAKASAEAILRNVIGLWPVISSCLLLAVRLIASLAKAKRDNSCRSASQDFM